MTDKTLHIAGISVAVALHVGACGGVWATDRGCLASASSHDLDEARHIEASLAIQGDEGTEESPEEPAEEPEEEEFAEPEPEPEELEPEEAESEPEEAEPEETEPTPAPSPEADPEAEPETEDFDPRDVLERGRQHQEDDDVELERPTRAQAGALDGSEWGTELEAEGDPYIGELRGRVERAWRLPSLERSEDELQAWGCVRLDESGAIAERELEKPSASSTLNRSVGLALEEATDMEEPVPDHLVDLVVEQGICFSFTP